MVRRNKMNRKLKDRIKTLFWSSIRELIQGGQSLGKK